MGLSKGEGDHNRCVDMNKCVRRYSWYRRGFGHIAKHKTLKTVRIADFRFACLNGKRYRIKIKITSIASADAILCFNV